MTKNRIASSLSVVFLSLVAALSLSGCESVRPGTLSSANDRLAQATQLSLLDQYPRWVSWPKVTLTEGSDVVMHRHNWSGPRDAMIEVSADIYGDRLIIAGRFRDNYPMESPFASPRRPLWWNVPYAGDAIEIRFVPLEARADPVTVLITFGAAGTQPQLTVLEAPRGDKGPVQGARVGWQKTDQGFEFAARATAMDQYGLLPYWSMAYRMEATFHDFDDGPDSYCALRGFALTKATDF